MHTTSRLQSPHPIRARFVRRLRVVLVRWLRARLLEESPVIDSLAPVEDRAGYRIRRRS